MKCSEFFQKFYYKNKKNKYVRLYNLDSKWACTEFFFKSAMDDSLQKDNLPQTNDAYDKWYDGARNPRSNVWTATAKKFNKDRLYKNLNSKLDKATLPDLMLDFGLSKEDIEDEDRCRFAHALVEQFWALVKGRGEAENCVVDAYRNNREPLEFDAYIEGATEELKWVRLPGKEERLLKDIYICNSVGTMPAVFPHISREPCLESVTLSGLRKFDERGETPHVLLVGGCGFGKTLMLQHLFLEAAKQRNSTGHLPIFGELRNFSNSYNDLVQYIVDIVKEYDRSFTYEAAIELLDKGRMQLLLDGLDELDPDETKHFQRKLAEFCHSFPKNQIVISTRQCSAMSGIRRFVNLYIQPLKEEQSLSLVKTLLDDFGDKKAMDTVLSFFDPDSGYVRKNSYIATNPMLLTIMVRNYKRLDNKEEGKIRFYELMYNSLIREHDEDKEAFERFFQSVNSRDEFTQVFREFCAISYIDGVSVFSHRLFEKYFKKLTTPSLMTNPSVFQLSAFQHDVCATACMMYEKERERELYYIDQGIQEYLFAEYYYFASTESTKKMGKLLQSGAHNSFWTVDALKMLLQLSDDKVKACILLPYLETLFKGKTEEEVFLRFLSSGYGNVTYTVFDEKQVRKYMKAACKFSILQDRNYPQNIILNLLSDILGLHIVFAACTEYDLLPQERATHFITGYYSISTKHDGASIENNYVLCTNKHEMRRGKLEYIKNMMDSSDLIKDEMGEPVRFGYVYSIDPLSVSDDTNKQRLFLEMCNEAKIYDTFIAIKAYYKELAAERKAETQLI